MSNPFPGPPQTPTHTVANKLIEMIRGGRNLDAIKTLYADNARHVEPMCMPGSDPNQYVGKANLLKMAEHWHKHTTIHGATCGDPTVNGDQFLCDMSLDCTSTDGPMAGKRMKMSESALYTVKDNKITEAKFFYRSMQMG